MAHTPKRKEFPLHLQSLRNRVDLARVEAYSVFSEEKSAADFYLENLLNTFVALVQYPVSFIIFDNSELTLRPLFHFCLDKAHYSWFTDMVNNSGGKNPWSQRNTFALFPGSLKDDFRIAVVHMHTKLRSDRSRCTPIETIPIIDILRANVSPSEEAQRNSISSSNAYISACSYFFFEEKWYGHYSRFSAESAHPLRKSIWKIHENYSGSSSNRKWPQSGAHLLEQQTFVAYPNSNSSAWTDCVNESLTQFIDDSRYGLHLFNAIANTQFEDVAVDLEARKKKQFSEFQPPNMIVAYRTFDRQHQNSTPLARAKLLRHLVKVRDDQEGEESKAQIDGYSYNVRFVMPNRNSREDGTIVESDPYSAYFRWLSKLRGTKPAHKKKIIPYQTIVAAQSYEAE